MKPLAIAVLIVAIAAFDALPVGAHASESAVAVAQTTTESTQERSKDADIILTLDQKKRERERRASEFKRRVTLFNESAQAYNTEKDRLIQTRDAYTERRKKLLKDAEYFESRVKEGEELYDQIQAMPDSWERDEKIREYQAFSAWGNEESARLRTLKLEMENEYERSSNAIDEQTAQKEDLNRDEAWLREEQKAIVQLDGEIAQLEAEANSLATENPTSVPSSQEASNSISASDLSQASVKVLRQIEDIKNFGALAQNVLVFGTIVSLLTTNPAEAVISWSGVGDSIDDLGTLGIATACFVKNYTMPRVISGNTGREK